MLEANQKTKEFQLQKWPMQVKEEEKLSSLISLIDHIDNEEKLLWPKYREKEKRQFSIQTKTH